MSQGTLYVNTLPRGILPKALVKALNLDITVADADTSEEFAKYFPLKKVPAFVGPNGAKLTEVIAITYYCMYTAAFFFLSSNLSTRLLYDEKHFKFNSYPCLNG